MFYGEKDGNILFYDPFTSWFSLLGTLDLRS